MTFSKHNWNQLSESSQRELKLKEAYEAGRRQGLTELASPPPPGTSPQPPPIAYPPDGAVGYVIKPNPNGPGWIVVWYSAMAPPRDMILGTSGPYDERPVINKGGAPGDTDEIGRPSNLRTGGFNIPPTGIGRAGRPAPRFQKREAYEAGRRQGLDEQLDVARELGWQWWRPGAGGWHDGKWVWYTEGGPTRTSGDFEAPYEFPDWPAG